MDRLDGREVQGRHGAPDRNLDARAGSGSSRVTRIIAMKTTTRTTLNVSNGLGARLALECSDMKSAGIENPCLHYPENQPSSYVKLDVLDKGQLIEWLEFEINHAFCRGAGDHAIRRAAKRLLKELEEE